MKNTQTYSRKNKVEEKRNIRKAIIFIVLTIGILVVFILYGFGALANFAVFLGELKKGSQPIVSDDQTPPIPPRFEPIPKATNQKNYEIKGSTEPGATIILSVNDNDHDLLANNEGEFRYAANLVDGENIISAFSQDDAGNKSNVIHTETIIFDNKNPELEITKPQDGATYYGSKERQLVIEGKTDEETKVNVNGRHVLVESTGKFTFLTTLSEGENKLTVKAEDIAGNTTEKVVTVTYSP
jgi:hypothetical protein